MPFWIALIISIAFSIIGQLLAPKTDGLKPEDKPGIPEIDESRPIGVLWGRALIKSPQLFWWGDYTTQAITKGFFTGLWVKHTTVGFKYNLGMALGIALGGKNNWVSHNSQHNGIDSIEQIQINEKVLWNIDVDGGFGGQNILLGINKPNFFGGKAVGANGGIKAAIEIHTGGDTVAGSQERSEYLATRLTRTSKWKSLAYLVWRGPSFGSGWYGNSANIEPLAIVAWRRPNLAMFLPPVSGTETFYAMGFANREANPAHCLAELFLNDDWGMGGVTEDDFDHVSWRAAAETLFNEGNSFSYFWDRQTSCEDMAEIILKQIDGVVYTDMVTGLLTLKLARADYDIDDLPTYGNDSFVEISSLTRGSWDDTINEVRVNYTNRDANFKSGDVFDQDLANFIIQDSLSVPVNINYPGCSNAALARKLCRRDLQALTQTLLRLTGKIDRTAHNLNPGSRFIFEWPEQGIEQVVMIVTTVKPGTFQDGTIEIEAVEDKFSAAAAIFSTGDSGWDDPITGPVNVTNGALGELPYWYAKDGLHRPYAYAARPNGSQLSFQWVLNGSVIDDDCAFTPSGTLTAAYGLTGAVDATGFTVEGITDPELIASVTSAENLSGVSLMWSGAEWMSYNTATDNGDGTITLAGVWRGQLDTVPVAHTSGSRVWFVGAHINLTEQDFSSTASLTGEFLTQTNTGVLDSASATDLTLTLANRAGKPYPPGNIAAVDTAVAGTAGFGDNFNDNTFNATLWSRSGSAQVVETNQRLEINTTGHSLTANSRYDFSNKNMIMRVFPIIATSASAMFVRLYHDGGNSKFIDIRRTSGNFRITVHDTSDTHFDTFPTEPNMTWIKAEYVTASSLWKFWTAPDSGSNTPGAWTLQQSVATPGGQPVTSILMQFIGTGAGSPFLTAVDEISSDIGGSGASGSVVVSWAHRNRLAQTTLVSQANGNIGPEPGTTYTVRVYGNSVLKQTVTAIAGTSYTYTAAQEVIDSGGPLFTSLVFQIDSVVSAVASNTQIKVVR